MAELELGEQLASWGKVIVIETRGRVTGRPVRAAIGFVDEPDGSILVAAGDPDAAWAANLVADPRATVTVEDSRREVEAVALDGRDWARAIRELILKYGTPAERLGAGSAFRLVQRDAGAAAGEDGD